MKNTPTGYIDPRDRLYFRQSNDGAVKSNAAIGKQRLCTETSLCEERNSPLSEKQRRPRGIPRKKRRTADISRPLRPHNNTKGAFAGSAFSEKTAPHQNGLASLLRPPSVFPKKLCRTKAAEDNPCPRREKQSPAWDPGRQNIRANDKETAARHQNTRSAA